MARYTYRFLKLSILRDGDTFDPNKNLRPGERLTSAVMYDPFNGPFPVPVAAS